VDVFAVRDRLVEDYANFTSGFLEVRDERIRAYVEEQLSRGLRWPDPWLSLNPTFEPGGTVDELVATGVLHPTCARVFRRKRDEFDAAGTPLLLHQHQRDAIEVARSHKSYVLTTGTGSGKSLAYLIPIVDRVLREGSGTGVKAVVVYPMNALANSQLGELRKFLHYGFSNGQSPVTFERYTGQERDEDRQRILANPPDILLTNYVMLELMLTRPQERKHLIAAAKGLQFLVLDELHTYRGRQGADVAMLVRRVRDACASPDLQIVGTSATMASGGSVDEQRAEVADLATRLFGTPVPADHVINETLRRLTPEPDGATREALRERVTADPPRTYEALLNDPLAGWIETTFGIECEEGSHRLVRRRPTTVPAAAKELSGLTGHDEPACTRAITSTLLAGSEVRRPDSPWPVFPFRLHQFLSKGDTVYVTLEPEATRHITTQYQVVAPGAANKLLVPLAFCRECGQEYLAVSRDSNGRYRARQERDASMGNSDSGYLYVSAEAPWPEIAGEGVRQLPESWIEEYDAEARVLPAKKRFVPSVVWVTPDGSPSDAHRGLHAAYVPSPFRFCLRCKVSYETFRGKDFSRLASLGSEGRSSATTVIGASLVRSLKEEPDLDPTARKLLTFTDNRQDASLQAGHFNDFVQVGLLRSALFGAVRAAGPSGLTHEVLAPRVVDALGLKTDDYAAAPGLKFLAAEQARRALSEVVAYRLYRDLERGWRITMPNLEQTGLLVIDYLSLVELAADEETWAPSHPALRDADTQARADICRIVLDEMRRNLAIRVDCLTGDGYQVVQKLSEQHLREPWSIPQDEPPVEATTVWPCPAGRYGSRQDVHFSARGALGRYLRKRSTFPHLRRALPVDETEEVIRDLLKALSVAGLVYQVGERDATHQGAAPVPGYRVNASGLRWLAGSGEARHPDPLRVKHGEKPPRVNPYFRDFYRSAALELGGLRAKEHTAQVPNDLRQKREEQFRAGTLPLLYCSPTMELGVDIADLNAVGMRNVPPTPANYAQRSGRAGRNGQPAIVVTYCTTGSGHDQYYFRRSDRMVSGIVVPPRLDVSNEDLVRAHVQAIWLGETDLDLRGSLVEVLDVSGEEPALTLQERVRTAIHDGGARRRAGERAEAILAEIAPALRDASWFDDGWLHRVLDQAPEIFDRACDRWRVLYRAALGEARLQSKRIQDASCPPDLRKRAEARRREAETQLRLLRVEERDTDHSDFYSYRYFASEGFLPGYSFPRLPLAAFIPQPRRVGNKDGDYLQRPRFLAVTEFGPGSLIYHEGARFQVARVQLPLREPGADTVPTEEAKRCEVCGYHHVTTASGPDVCEECGAPLGVAATNLLRMATVFTRRRERISSDEEERRRAGFKVVTSYRFADHGERPGRIPAAVSVHGRAVATLAYGDTVTIRRTNVGFRSRADTDTGFPLDVDSGAWLSDKAAKNSVPDAGGLEDLDKQRAAYVLPFVEDRRNALVLTLAAPPPLEAVATLQHALKRAIEVSFDIEDNELATDSLPDAATRSRLLFYESAEGGAGVLRRLVGEPDEMARVARTALALLHFDPDTGEDLGGAPHAEERCEQACYDCLLSYSNQPDHRLLNRHLVAPLLRDWLRASVTPGTDATADDIDDLDKRADSELERRFLRTLRDGGYRLPTHAQRLLEDAGVRPDFLYQQCGAQVAIFVDGPAHTIPEQRRGDADADERLADLGWEVLRFRHDDDWGPIIRHNGWVFGPGREGAS